MTGERCIVLGSGPSAVACAKALVGRGATVRVIDVGNELEPGKREVFDRLAGIEPARWPADLDRAARDSMQATTKGVPNKSVYGSYYPYAFDDPDLPLVMDDAEVAASFALGGLSNAWGASILPYRDEDIRSWPIRVADLAPHYRAVLEFVPLAGSRDELEERFPLFTDRAEPIERTAQIARVLAHWRAHSGALARAGIAYGGSRLAVHADPSSPAHCRRCGLCMYGCPYDSIYSSAHTLAELVAAGAVEYLPGIHADRVEEEGSIARVHGHERTGGAPASFEADRVYVACGYVSSTRLVLESLGRRPSSARFKDSLYFLVPMLMLRAAPTSTPAQGNTFAQAYLEVAPAGILERHAHLQVYGYSDIMLKAASSFLDRHRTGAERVLQPLVGRMLAVQGFLHSDDSPEVALHLDGREVRLVGHGRSAGEATVHRLVGWLARQARATGLVPLPRMTQIGLPGKSFHTGGSLPMQRDPSGTATDLLGRPAGWRRVHVVDTSVLPTIPATTITLTAMANAHRIASATPEG